ncbi:MAG: phosphoglycerate mutase [Rhodoferax sp.]|nr:phosphoglycerate mutase [Rhodoferax sp.]
MPDNAAMHLLIPFASGADPGCAARLRALALPRLTALLARLTAQPADAGDPRSLSPPHERALAQARGLPLQDGLLPWAALDAQAAGLTRPGDGLAWARVTLCHWEIGTHQVSQRPGPLPGLTEADSQALMAAAAPYFAGDGIDLHAFQPQHWLAQGPPLHRLPTASVDRVAGQEVHPWLPAGPGGALLRRLQTEMQMLFYNHPVNDARSAQGLPTVNALWFSGSGELAAAARPAPELRVIDTLREPALAGDWEAWAHAWQALDAGPLADLLALAQGPRSVSLTLCGEHSARSWVSAPRPIWQKVWNQIRPKAPYSLIYQL